MTVECRSDGQGATRCAERAADGEPCVDGTANPPSCIFPADCRDGVCVIEGPRGRSICL
jgi:hypothetical protein